MLSHQIQQFRVFLLSGQFFLQARGYLQSLPFKPKVPWAKLYPSADPKGNDNTKTSNLCATLAHPLLVGLGVEDGGFFLEQQCVAHKFLCRCLC